MTLFGVSEGSFKFALKNSLIIAQRMLVLSNLQKDEQLFHPQGCKKNIVLCLFYRR